MSHGFFKAPTPIRYFNHTIEGNILLGGNLLNENVSCKHLSKIYYTFNNEEERKSYEMNTAILNALFGETQSVISEQEQDKLKKVLFSINKLDLYGIEFRLFDARCLYPDDDRISFVFLRTPYCSKSFMD